MSPQTPPLDRRDLYKERRYDRPPGNSSDASRYPYSSRDYSRRAPSGYYKSYPEESGSRGDTPSRSDRFYYEEHSYRGYNNHRYERGRTSNRDRSFRRSPRYDPYHHHTDYLRRSPNYEPYHHHTDYLRRSPNYEPYHHDQYPPDHHHHHHHHQRMIRSMAVPYSSSSRVNPDDYHKRLSSERRSDWERERERERDRDRERERDRERKRDDGAIRWSRSARERECDASESVVKRNQDDYKGFEEDLPAKKARLGWGQGLAKYEKLKVGDPEPFKEFVININNNNDINNNFNNNKILEKEVIVEKEKESVACKGEIGAENNATCQSLIGSKKDVMPCQVLIGSEKYVMTCQDPIGAENKVMTCQALICSKKDDDVIFEAPIEPVKVAIVVTSATENEETPCVATTENKECEEEEEILPDLDILDGNSNFALASFLTNLLQKEDSEIGDVTLHRLGALKEDISKQIEITETEIDLLETEIKLLEHDDNNNNNNDNVIIPSPELIIINNESNTSSEEREINTDDSLNIITPVQKSSPEYDNKTTLLSPEPNPNLIIPKILASNLHASNKANSVIITNGLIIPDQPKLEILVSAIKSQNEKQMRIKEMIRVHKKEIKFKEMILAHKYRVFRHIWKEDLKLIPDKKSRSKSNCSYKNNISRTRLYSSAGNLTPVGTKKALQFTKKLMSSNSLSKIFRPHLKMPCLILSQTEKNHSKFISRNGLISDPVTSEKGKTVINPWTQFEKETFIHMLCTFGKDFTKISSFLPHKTTADCVQFYYKNHKKKFFKDMKRLSVTNETKSLTGGNSNYLGFNEPKTLAGGNTNYLGFNEPKTLPGSNNNYLGFNEPKTLNGGNNNYLGFNDPKTLTGGNSTSAKKRKRENNSVQNIPPPKNNSKNNNINNLNNKKKLPTLVKLKSNASDPPKRVNYSKKTKSVDLSTPLPPPNPNPNSLSPDPTKKSNSSEGVSSCITNSIYNEKENNNFLEEDEGFCSDDGWREVDSNHWTNEEKSLFIKGLALYGKDFNKISNCVGTRSSDQCKVFFSKSWKSLSLDAGFEINGNPGIVNPGIGNTGNENPGIGDCEKGSSSDEVCMAEEISDVKIFGRIIACKQGDGNNGNNDNNEGVLSEIKPGEIKDAIISVLADVKENVASVEGLENSQNKKDVIESLPVVDSGRI